jgi:hypothetical protein
MTTAGQVSKEEASLKIATASGLAMTVSIRFFGFASE